MPIPAMASFEYPDTRLFRNVLEKKDMSTIRKLGKPVVKISLGIPSFRVKKRGRREMTVSLLRRMMTIK